MPDVVLSEEFLALWNRFLALDPPTEELKRIHERYDAKTLPLQRLAWQTIARRMAIPPVTTIRDRQALLADRAATAEERKRLLNAIIAALQEGRG